MSARHFHIEEVYVRPGVRSRIISGKVNKPFKFIKKRATACWVDLLARSFHHSWPSVVSVQLRSWTNWTNSKNVTPATTAPTGSSSNCFGENFSNGRLIMRVNYFLYQQDSNRKSPGSRTSISGNTSNGKTVRLAIH
ncbi:MAG: Uncharacterised protein [Flavobacteriales bacterium UBA4585]|nr:MAG: Uncharacterised protein [Flavobacteriales bacterium UBA4585]